MWCAGQRQMLNLRHDGCLCYFCCIRNQGEARPSRGSLFKYILQLASQAVSLLRHVAAVPLFPCACLCASMCACMPGSAGGTPGMAEPHSPAQSSTTSVLPLESPIMPRYTVDESGAVTYVYDEEYIRSKYEIFSLRVYHRWAKF